MSDDSNKNSFQDQKDLNAASMTSLVHVSDMEVKGEDDYSGLSSHEKNEEINQFPIEALKILEKIEDGPLKRAHLVSQVIDKIIPQGKTRNSTEVSISSIPPSRMKSKKNRLGLNGVGKTVLAAMVLSEKKVRDFYKGGIAWLDVGKRDNKLSSHDYSLLLRSICSQLGIGNSSSLIPELFLRDGEPKIGRERRENEYFQNAHFIFSKMLKERTGPVLIILDNLKNEDDLQLFKFDVGSESERIQIVVTTRLQNLLPKKACVTVGVLTDEESKFLLKRESGDSGIDDVYVKKFIRMCQNHPLAIRSLGLWLKVEKSSLGKLDSSHETYYKKPLEILEGIQKGKSTDVSDLIFGILDACLYSQLFVRGERAVNLLLASLAIMFRDDSVTHKKIPTCMVHRSYANISKHYGKEKLLSPTIANKLKHVNTPISFAMDYLTSLGIVHIFNEENEITGETHEYMEFNHEILMDYSSTVLANCKSRLDISTENAKTYWSDIIVQTIIDHQINFNNSWKPNAIRIYGFRMLPIYMIRARLYEEALDILTSLPFIRDRINHFGLLKTKKLLEIDCALFNEYRLGKTKENRITKAYRILADVFGIFIQILNDDQEKMLLNKTSNEEIMILSNNIGVLLSENGFWIEAMSAYELSLKFVPQSTDIVSLETSLFYNVGTCLYELNLYSRCDEFLEKSMNKYQQIDKEDQVLKSLIVKKVGDLLLACSMCRESLTHYETSLEILEQTQLDECHLYRGDILHNKANLLWILGQANSAVNVYKQALEYKNMCSGTETSASLTHFMIGNVYSTLKGCSGLAKKNFEMALDILQSQHHYNDLIRFQMSKVEGALSELKGDKVESIETYKKLVQYCRFRFPYKKVEVASLIKNVAHSHTLFQNFALAFEKYSESLNILRKCNGFIPLEVSNVLLYMATAHEKFGWPEIAFRCTDEALKIQKLRLGDCELTSLSLEKLGDYSRQMNDVKAAESFYERALHIRETRNQRDVFVANIIEKMGELMEVLTYYDEALNHFKEALQLKIEELGSQHEEIGSLYFKMASVLYAQKEFEKAMKSVQIAQSIRENKFGFDHEVIAETLSLRGKIEFGMEKFLDSLENMQESLRIYQLLKKQIKVAETMQRIGDNYKKRKKFEIAVDCYEESIRVRREERYSGDHTLSEYLITLGNLMNNMGQFDNALIKYDEALKIRSKAYGNQDDRVAAVMKNIAFLEFRRGSIEKARKLLIDVVEIRRSNGSNNDADYVNTLCLIGNIYRIEEHLQEAINSWREAYVTIFQNNLGDEMTGLVDSLENLMEKTARQIEQLHSLPAFAYELGLEKATHSSKGRHAKNKLDKMF